MKKKLSRLEIKQAILTDSRFRDLFPELEKEIKQVIKNPGCACHIPVYDKFFEYKDRLGKYFSNNEIVHPKDEAKEASQNNWKVITCKSHELENKLNELHKFGRKQIAVARYQDDVTVIINDMGIVF